MTRRERIAFLLTHLEDVRFGVRERGASGEHIPLMCAAWNAPGYQELERLLPLLRAERPRLASHLLEAYFAPERQVLQCPRCRDVMPAWSSVNFHRHGHSNIAVVPRVLRMTSPQLCPELVSDGIAWLDERRQAMCSSPTSCCRSWPWRNVPGLGVHTSNAPTA